MDEFIRDIEAQLHVLLRLLRAVGEDEDIIEGLIEAINTLEELRHAEP